jgi:coenzyme F420-reducing hydrogenase alpha subunit
MENKLTIYDCEEIIRLIEAKANEDSGEISDSDLALLVEAQTGSIEKLGKLIGYIKHLEAFVDTAKAERDRIKAREDSAKNRLESIKKYLLPYVQRKGKVTVGTHTLSTRKSEGVVLAEGFDNKMYCRHIPESWEPDLPKIKESIKAGIMVAGALLEEREGLVIR